MWKQHLSQLYEKAVFALIVSSRIYWCDKTDEQVEWLSDMLTYVHPWNRFHGMNISETINLISTPNQIFVFPNICLCWWKTSSSDGKNIWLNVKKKLRQNIDFETKPNIVTDANDRKYYQNRNSWATIQLTFPKAFTHKMWIYVSRLKSNSS